MINQKFEILLRKSFFSDVLKLAGGTAIAQVLSILASPIITRMYGPEAFGLSALFASITGIIAVVACLRYELAIMLPEKDEDAANLLALSLILAATMSIITAFVVWLSRDTLLSLLKAPGLEPYLWMVPISVFLSGVFLALNYWNSRAKCFGRLSIARLTASVAATGTQLGAGISGHPTGGNLIGASMLGSAVSTLMLGVQIWKGEKSSLTKSLSWTIFFKMLKRYKTFPILSTWSALLNTVSWQLPILLLSSFFSLKVTGFYSLSFMMISLPMSLIGSAIGQVFFQRAAEAKRNGGLPHLVENIFEILIVIGMLPMLMLTFEGRDIFVVFFGETWSEAGIFSQILALWALVWFISSPLSTLIDVLEKQEFGLKYNIANFVARLIALSVGGLFFKDARLALLLFAIAGALVYGYLCIGIMLHSGLSLSRVYLIILRYFSKCILGIIVVLTLKILGANPLVCIFASGLFFIIYYYYLIKIDRDVPKLFKIFDT